MSGHFTLYFCMFLFLIAGFFFYAGATNIALIIAGVAAVFMFFRYFI